MADGASRNAKHRGNFHGSRYKDAGRPNAASGSVCWRHAVYRVCPIIQRPQHHQRRFTVIRSCEKAWPFPWCHCEKRSADLSAEALAKAEAIHPKFQLDCRSRQASFAMTSQVCGFSHRLGRSGRSLIAMRPPRGYKNAPAEKAGAGDLKPSDGLPVIS